MNLSDPVVAALIGASATMVTALIQLRLSWRKEIRERERGQPISRKSRRGPVLLVFALMIGAAVGGFAASQYLMEWRNGDRDLLRAEIQAKLAEISATAAQLERTRVQEAQVAVRAADCGRVPVAPALKEVSLFPEEGAPAR
jgi:hypothetical protein